MKLAMPIVSDQGLDSEVSEHFGRSECFLIYDTSTGTFNVLDFRKDEEGTCSPARFLMNLGVDALYVLGIGFRAREMLEMAGIRVKTGPFTRVRDVIEHLDELEDFRGGCVH